MTYAMKIHVDVPCKTASVIFASLHHQQIHIAIRSHLPTCCRAKKNDLLWLGDFHAPPHDLLKDLFTHGLPSAFHIALFGSSKIRRFFSLSVIRSKAAHQATTCLDRDTSFE